MLENAIGRVYVPRVINRLQGIP